MSFVTSTYNRLKSVSLRELPYRLNQVIRKYFIDLFYQKLPILKKHKLNLGNSLMVMRSKSDIDINESDMSIRIYRLKNFDILKNSEWRKDHFNNIQTPINFSSLIDKQNFEKYGDVKYVWEISRFYHLPYSSLLSIESKSNLSEIVQKQISDWIDANPFLKSINWVSGIEVGVRTINWLIAVNTLKKNNLVDDDFLKKFQRSLNQHVHYLRTHLSEYSSANNHLIAELVGLLYGTAHLNGKQPEKWFRYALDRLEQEISNQYCQDGGSREQSTHYHAFTLDLYLFAWVLLESKDLSFSETTKQQIYKSAIFLKSFWTNNDSCIEVGDSDNSYVVYNPFEENFDHYSSILSACAKIFNDPKLLPGEEIDSFHSDFLKKHLNFDQGEIPGNSVSNKNKLICSNYLDSGYVIAEDQAVKMIIDVGFLGMGRTAAHGHSDILHFTLNVNGYPLIVDTGTYQYHRRYSFWRNYFRSSEAHNTISVNNLNQAEMLGRMNWGKRPAPRILNLIHDNNFFELEACHDGFERQGIDVNHNRKFSYNREDKKFIIHDFLTSSETNIFKYRLHFHPDIEYIRLNEDTLHIKDNRFGEVNIISSYFNNAKLVKGNVELPLGWYSKSFDEKEPTNVLKLNLTKKEDFEIKTEIEILV